MFRAVFFGFPAHGHMRPSLVLVRELLKLGHEVVYYSSEKWRRPVEQQGAFFRAYTDEFLGDFEFAPEQLPDLPALLMGAVESVLDCHFATIQQERIDYVIHDSVAPWGPVTAQRLSLPSVSSTTTFALSPRVLAGARGLFSPPDGASFRRKAGALLEALRTAGRIRQRGFRPPRLRTLYGARSPLNIVYTSREFQPKEELFGSEFAFVGPAEMPASPSPAPAGPDEQPLVLVSLGTLFNRRMDLFSACMEALAGLPVRGVITTGGGLSPDDLPTPAPNCTVETFVDQPALLSGVRAAVSRGGMNTVSECISRAVPVLVVPELAEQAVVGRQVAELGAGLALRETRVTVDRLRGAITDLLSDDRFVRRCRRLSRGFRAGGGAAAAAQLIAGYVSGGSDSSS